MTHCCCSSFDEQEFTCPGREGFLYPLTLSQNDNFGCGGDDDDDDDEG